MIRVLIPLRVVVTVFAIIASIAASGAASPLAKLRVPDESFEVGTLHIERHGSGQQSLILIPGLAGGPWVWAETITKFSPSYTVYTITLPGFDGRPATDEKLLFDAFARDFWEMLDARKIEKPIVIGHSLGGTLAIALAEEHPQRLCGIVAVDGLPVFPMLAQATPEQRAASATQMASAYASLSQADTLAAQKRFMSTIGTNKPELVEAAARLQARSDPKAIAAWLQETLVCDLRPKLSRITIPFLQVMPYDAVDEKLPMHLPEAQTLAFYRSLLKGAPESAIVTIKPARHFIMLDQPAAFHDAIEKFLASIKR
jgi:pimeloyl-ACP methyl ester carboxylesterase